MSKPENIDKELDKLLDKYTFVSTSGQRVFWDDHIYPVAGFKRKLSELIHSSNKSFASQIAQKNKEIREEVRRARIEEAEVWNSKWQSILGKWFVKARDILGERSRIAKIQIEIDEFVKDRLASLKESNKGE